MRASKFFSVVCLMCSFFKSKVKGINYTCRNLNIGKVTVLREGYCEPLS